MKNVSLSQILGGVKFKLRLQAELQFDQIDAEKMNKCLSYTLPGDTANTVTSVNLGT